MEKIDKFSEVAGTQLNIDKSEAMSMRPHIIKVPEYLGLRLVDNTRCLGIHVGFNKKICQQKNWDEKIDKLRATLDQWKTRELTYFGKITIMKMLALPKIIFSATNTSTPEYVINSVEKILFEFLWGKRHKLKKGMVINDISVGGLNMVDVRSFLYGLKAAWIGRYIQTHDQQWAILMKHNINIFHENLLLHMNFTDKHSFPLLNKLPSFYQEVIISFNKSKCVKKPEDHDQLLDNIIWGNRYFTILDKKSKKEITLFFKHWTSQNLIKIRHLLIIEGKVDQNYIYNKLEIKAGFLFEMHMLLTALKPYMAILGTNIPEQIIYTLPTHPQFDMTSNTDISCKKSKFYYTLLVQKKRIQPDFTSWKQETNLENIPQIQEIMKTKVRDIRENKLKEFNYKLINRLGACGKLVNKWDKNIRDTCVLCGTTETQLHIIYTCPIANCLWIKVSNIIKKQILPSHIIFGIKNNRPLNNLISQIAFSIHKYWIIRTKDKIDPDGNTLLHLVSSDLKHKSYIMLHIKENEISQIFNKTSYEIL